MEQLFDKLEKGMWEPQKLAFNALTGSSLYSGLEDVLVGSDCIEFGSSLIFVNSVKVCDTIRVNNDKGALEAYFRIRYEALRDEKAIELFNWLGKQEYFKRLEGHIKVEFDKMADKEFYQLRSWLMMPDDNKLPHGFTIEEESWVKNYKHHKYGVVFKRESEAARFNPSYGLMCDERLFELIKNCNTRRVVNEGELLRKVINKHLPSWSFKSVSSIQEHHFTYSEEEKKLWCFYMNTQESRVYSIGKGLKRIGELIGADISLLTSDKIKDISLSLETWNSGTLRVVDGDEIAHFYHYNQYASGKTGTLEESCMRYNNLGNAFKSAYGNQSVCKMLIMESNAEEGKILGRALLWTLDDGMLFMDRIYASEGNVKKFKEWAKENGYWHKARQSFDDPHEIANPVDEVTMYKKMHVTLDVNEFLWNDSRLHFPYMDTFKYLNQETGELINYAPDDGQWCLQECTNGYGDYEVDYDDYDYEEMDEPAYRF